MFISAGKVSLGWVQEAVVGGVTYAAGAVGAALAAGTAGASVVRHVDGERKVVDVV